MDSNLHVVIPAKDEALRIESLLKNLHKTGIQSVIVVDDGSSDNTSLIAKRHTKHVIRHKLNLGAGAATRTGIDYALHRGAEYIILIDGDGQHNPQEIPMMFDYTKNENYDLVVGSRFIESTESIPTSRRIYNYLGNIVTQIVTGVRVTDSQSGFRCMSRRFALENPIEWDGFEFCTEMFRNVKKRKYRIGEIPISVKYTKETMAKGQSFWSGIRMMAKIIMTHIHGR